MSGSAGVSDDLTSVVARASGVMVSDQTVDTLLRLLTSAAERVVTSATGAGLTVVDPDGGLVTLAATDPTVEQLDALQYELDEGPCLTAWRDRTVVRVDDVTTEQRWPRWAAEAARTSVRCCLSAPLVVGNSTLGAVKVYAAAADAFDDHDDSTLHLFAAQAAILLGLAGRYRRAGEVGETLRTLLRQRDDLQRACGVLMERERLTPEAALTFVMSMAERDGRTVQETAARLLRGAGQ